MVSVLRITATKALEMPSRILFKAPGATSFGITTKTCSVVDLFAGFLWMSFAAVVLIFPSSDLPAVAPDVTQSFASMSIWPLLVRMYRSTLWPRPAKFLS
ncbi:hypothetical protein [Pyrobaculum sp.]|uniref:hypothetical protein n=1 Tax=Pyrobaculum sp. TaxID=2004705 RepID=UPI0031806501